MPTPCSRCARLGTECRVDLSSGRCSECIRVGRKAGKSGCDLVVTDEDWSRLLNLRKRVREELEKLGEEDDRLGDESADLARKLLVHQQKQELLKRKRRRLETQYLKLHAEQGELVERELESALEAEALEEAEKAKALGVEKGAASPEGAVPLSGREALAEDDPLNFLNLSSQFLDGSDPFLDGLLGGTVESVPSPH